MDNIIDNIINPITRTENDKPRVFSYADIVKRQNTTIKPTIKPIIKPKKVSLNENDQVLAQTILENIQKHSVFIQPKINTDFNNKILILLNKILKHEKNNKQFSVAINEIRNIIIRTQNTNESIIKSMSNINYVLNNYRFKKLIDTYKSNPHHKYVALSISNIIKKYFPEKNNELVIADIGGGEGNVIKFIGDNLNIPDKNLFCIEQNEWSEKYAFENTINYIFWDNVNINLPENSVDICLLMVSMHHMSDTIINNVLTNINKLLKKDGIIIIKEHDALNTDVINVINWEHHLYHIMTVSNEELTNEKLNSYLMAYIDNFKSKKTFDNIFNEHGFCGIEEMDRQFNPFINHDELNSTNLYWKIYKKY